MHDKINKAINSLSELIFTSLNMQKFLSVIIFVLLILLLIVKLYKKISIEIYFKKHPEQDPFNFK